MKQRARMGVKLFVLLTPLNERGPTVPELPTICLQANNGCGVRSSDTATLPRRNGSNACSAKILSPESSNSAGDYVAYPDHVVLGRNRHTGIQDVSLSRQVCRVSVESCPLQKHCASHSSTPKRMDERVMQEGNSKQQAFSSDSNKIKDGPSSDSESGVTIKLQLLKKQGELPVTVNGEPLTIGNGSSEFVELKDGYVLGLQMHRLLYRVSTAASAPSRSLSDSHTERGSVTSSCIDSDNAIDHSNNELKEVSSAREQQAFNQFRDEMMCSICMEIMVNATALQPCGHMYCSECVVPLERCPTCRRTLYGRTPSKQVDSMISNLVLIGKTFDYEDALQFVKRSGSGPDQFKWIKEKDIHSVTSTSNRKRSRDHTADNKHSSPHLSPSREQRRRMVDSRGNIIIRTIIRSGAGTSGNNTVVQNVISTNTSRSTHDRRGARFGGALDRNRSGIPSLVSSSAAQQGGGTGDEVLNPPIISYTARSPTATSSGTGNGTGGSSLSQFSPRRNITVHTQYRNRQHHLAALTRAISRTNSSSAGGRANSSNTSHRTNVNAVIDLT